MDLRRGRTEQQNGIGWLAVPCPCSAKLRANSKGTLEAGQGVAYQYVNVSPSAKAGRGSAVFVPNKIIAYIRHRVRETENIAVVIKGRNGTVTAGLHVGFIGGVARSTFCFFPAARFFIQTAGWVRTIS